MPLWLQAGLWGLLGGSALLLGAGVGYFVPVPQRVVAGIMAFGAGVLISALSFDLMDEAFEEGGVVATGTGFVIGALIYTGANWWLAHRGARHRKRSNAQQPSEDEHAGSGLAIAAGALIDGIPESIVIGVGLLAGGEINWVTVAAVFLSNIPEGLSSAAGMRKAGRGLGYIFGVWGAIALVSGVAALLGNLVFGGFGPSVIAAVTGVAAGGILTMLVETMIPEAFHEAHNFAGLITVIGFLVAFALTKYAS